MVRRFLLQLAGLFLLESCLWAQQAGISGFVKDPSGSAIPKAQVTVRNTATNTQQNTETNNSGIYIFPVLPPGKYQLSASGAGFENKVIDDITLETAGKVTLDVTLSVGATSQTVTVEGGGIHINTTDASVSTVIDRQFVENMPLNGRSFQSLLTTVPGVTQVSSQGVGYSGEITVNGQRTEANYFTVDGVGANTGVGTPSGAIGLGAGYSGSTPGESALGSTQSLVSIDALEEFRAATSTYSAEYGRTPGGQFSFTTRSGTNIWHGSGYDYLRNGVLDANNWFNNAAVPAIPKPAERQNDFGGTLGGPLSLPGLYNGKDKTFFFFSYEGLRLQNPVAATLTEVPSLSLRRSVSGQLADALNAFPVPNGKDLGNGLAYFTGGYSSPGSLDTTSIRIDHNINDRFRVFGRFSNSPSSSTNRTTTALSVLGTSEIDVRTLTLGTTNILSSRLTNEARFNLTWNNAGRSNSLDDFGGAVPLALADLPGLQAPNSALNFILQWGLNPGLALVPKLTNQRQLNITDTVGAVTGNHVWKWGIDYRRIINPTQLPPVYEYPDYLNATQVLQNQPVLYLFQFSTTEIKPVFTNVSAFVQDEWKVTPRLSLSLGLRWDINPPPGDASGHLPYTITTTDLATVQLAAKGTSLWQTRYNNLAPRLGLAWQAHQSTGWSTVLRTGFGTFYDTTGANAALGYWGIGYRVIDTYSGTPFPLTAAQIAAAPLPDTSSPYNSGVYAYDPHLKSPYVFQWNVAVEQGLGQHQSLTVSYVGSAGRDLLIQKLFYPGGVGNANFISTNPLFITGNGASSDYSALQVQFQCRLSHGLQAQTSYTWSHSLDDVSSNFTAYQQHRASSDFDIRNNFQAALTYDFPNHYQHGFRSAVLGGWALDARISARSALPVDVVGGISFDPVTGGYLYYHPNVVAGQPLYLSNANAPAGRQINYSAFTPAPAGKEGNLGRNALRAFDAVQADIAIRREFPIRERLGLQFRAEAFNILNHPVMGSIYNQLSYGQDLFGKASGTQNSALGGLNALYQVGGPRSLQLALRLHF